VTAVLRILHLEDDPSDAEIIQGVLENGGIECEVQRVDSREAFTAAVAAGGHDLILADFSLPEFDGLSALKISAERRPDVPFIFVSGTLGEETAVDAMKIGATDYVLKERLSRLVNSVQRALREARERSQRRKAEEHLRRSEALLAQAQRISHTGSWSWTLSSGKVVWSEEQYRMFGLNSGSEASLQAFFELVHPDDRGRLRRTLADATAARRPYAINYRVLLPDGGLRHMHSVGTPAAPRDGAVDEYLGTTSDVTERVHAETALRARQQMLELAQKAARAAAFEWRLGPGPEQEQPSVELDAMYGLAPGAHDGSFESWKRLVHPQDWSAVAQAVVRAELSGDFDVEYRLSLPDGQIRWLQAKGRRFAEPGSPARLVGFMLDITERREAEEQLRRLQARLRQSQHLEAMGTLAGGIAHDFNNILGAILGYGEMALRDAQPGTRLRRDLDGILAAGERGRALVDRVLSFSRSGIGERVAVEVQKVAGEVLELLAAKLPRGIRIETALEAGPATMRGDPTQMHQLLMNLATNAIQAMPDGGTLRVSLRQARFDSARVASIGGVAAADYIVLEVADSGGGIAPELQDRIFDPFFTTRQASGGTGLGLSLVHGIVREVGGAIDLVSAPGQGASFTVYLPQAGEAAAEETPPPRPQPSRGKGQRVLFVDDEEALVRLAGETLQELGYRPLCFVSPGAALEVFRANPTGFDAVVTDERMPGMSGCELIRELRALNHAVPILLLSGYVGGAVSASAYQAGANDILKKPLSAGALSAGLAQVLQA
jgi:PAS domain S-box-containing protein